MKTSVLIVTFQSEGYIAQCVNSVLACDAETEIIVVDNASSDATVAVLRQYPQVQVQANSENIGFSAAVNQAARCATGDFLLLLNPDTLLCKSSLSRMLATLERRSHLAAVGPVSNNAGGVQSARHWLPDPLKSSVPENREEVADFLSQKFGGHEAKTKLLTGFCLLIRTPIFSSMGGLDPQLVLGFDDLDLCFRIAQKGGLFAVSIDAFVFHAWHKSFEAGSRPVVEAMHHRSLVHFSNKLVQHFGQLSLIPTAMELWGVDWFTPVVDDAPRSTQEVSMSTKYCILVKRGAEAKHDACQFSLGAFVEAQIPASDILILDLNGSGVPGLDSAVDVWTIRVGTPWKSLFEKLQRWFGECRLVLVEAGVAIHPGLLGQFESGTGPILDGTGKSTVPSDVREFALNLLEEPSSLPNRWLVTSLGKTAPENLQIPFHASWVAQSMSWTVTIAKASARLLEFATQSSSAKIGEELPGQLQKHLSGYRSVGVMGKGQLLDLENNYIQLSACDCLVWRIDPLELPGLSHLIKALRGNGLKKVLFLFDNVHFQRPGALVPERAISPLDLRREVQQGGFRISSMEHWSDFPQVPLAPRYANTQLRIDALLPDEVLLETSSRILLVAEPCQSKHYLSKKVSIVLLALNQVEYTRKCIENLQKYCRQEYELILVNNGSKDGTAAYFDSIPGAKVIHNPKNLGVAPGWNQGMKLATGDYVLILNNDTIPGPNFLENLVRCAENHPESGMVVPRSNRIAGPQLVEGFEWKSEDEIPGLSAKIQEANELSAWEFPRLKGFCMLMPRRVVERIGPFDEQYGFGNFEDDDYSCRIRYSGHTLLVADDSFLFHFGSVSFKDSGIDWNKQMTENMGKFDRKWSAGRKSGIAFLAGTPVLAPKPAGVLVDGFSWLNAGNIVDAQKAFQALVDANPRDARANFGLGKCLRALHQAKDAFALFCRSLELDPAQNDVAQVIVDLLANDFGAESITGVLDYLRRKYPGLQAFSQEAGVDSFSHVDWVTKVEAFLEAKQYAEALTVLLDVRQRKGEDFQVCNLLGIVKFQQGVIDEAVRWFEAALKSNPCDSDAILNYYDALLRLGIPQKVISVMEHALGLEPSLYEVRMALQDLKSRQKSGRFDANSVIESREVNIAAEHLIREGMSEKAGEMLEGIVAKQPDNYRALNNLGLLKWYAQEMSAAFDLFAQAIDLNPWYLDAVVNLYDCAFLSRRMDEFIPWLERAEAANPGAGELAQIRKDISGHLTPERLQMYFRKDAEQAKLEEQIRTGHRLLEEQKIDSAVILFTDLLRAYPENVDCLNGVGIVAFYRGQHEDAWEIFRAALELAPLDQDTLVNYWDVCVKLGRQAEGLAALQNALAVDPSLSAVARILEEN